MLQLEKNLNDGTLIQVKLTGSKVSTKSIDPSNKKEATKIGVSRYIIGTCYVDIFNGSIRWNE